jgi:hypothetical protein
MLQDGVGETQDRKEYKREELQEERKRDREVEETWCKKGEKRVKKKKECYCMDIRCKREEEETRLFENSQKLFLN